MTDIMRDEFGAPQVVDRSTFDAELDALRVRQKAHTREGDVIAAARRRLPNGGDGPEPQTDWPERPGRAPGCFRRPSTAGRLLFHVEHRPSCAAAVRGMYLGYDASPRAVLSSFPRCYFPVFCQGPYEESARSRDFTGWEMPWYSAPRDSLEKLLVGRRIGRCIWFAT